MNAAEHPGGEKAKAFFLNYGLYMLLGLMLVVVVCVDPAFLTANNIVKILQKASPCGILALGMAGIIVLRGVDLSAGRILGTCAAVTYSLVQSVTYASHMWPNLPQLPLAVPFLISIAVAVAFCAINGFGVTMLKVPAYMMTWGTQLVAYGVTCLYLDAGPKGGSTLSSFDRKFIDLVNGGFQITKEGEGAFDSLVIPYLVLYFAAAAIVMWLVWHRTTLGKNMFAIGRDKTAAAASGVNIARNTMGVYLVAGVLYGIAAFLETGRIQTVNTATGLNYDLDAISGCVIGGVSLSGGVGTIPGIVIGVVLLQMINYSLYFLGINPHLQYVVKGLLLILVVAVDVQKYLAKNKERTEAEIQKGETVC